MSYTFAQLTPERVPNAHIHNASLLGNDSYGIEVTEPELARGCLLGNLDPQHSVAGSGEAAVEAALTCALPPDGARLVTIRPDMDALAAMAIFSLRANGTTLSQELIQRAALIAQADRFDFGSWPGLKPPPATDAEWLAFASEPLGLAPVAALAMDSDISLDERVKSLSLWLKSGKISSKYKDAIERHAALLAEAYAGGRIAISVHNKNSFAVVVSDIRDALRLGYRLAPVVVGLSVDPARQDTIHRKVTVAQYCHGLINLRALSDKLNNAEPGWGGSATILGSPQGVGSAIPTVRLIAEIERSFATTAIERR